MIQDLAIGEGRGLAKIDEPHTSTMAMVMHEEERAADHLPTPRQSGTGLPRDTQLSHSRFHKAQTLSPPTSYLMPSKEI